MTLASNDDRAVLRKSVYAILLFIAAGDAAGRLLAVNSVSRAELEQHAVNQRVEKLRRELVARGVEPEQAAVQAAAARPDFEPAERRQTPFLSGNDRSRWLAIRSLVEQGTFAIDGVLDRRTWNSIDMVQHRGRDGELHLYSSKPPLLNVLMAGEYWLVHKLTGWTLAENPYEVGRLMLLIVNVPALLWMLALVARWAERLGASDWGRIFVVAASSLGTMLRPFAVVLNNHLLGAAAAAVALDAVIRICLEGERRVRWFAVAGLAGAFAAADELPALSLLAAAGLALLLRDRRAWTTGFLPAAGVVIVAFFGANYAVHDSLRPPYAHRRATDANDNWYDYSYTVDGQTRPSYWRDPQGIDRGEPSKTKYALHMLFGHHGVFSLTPVWLLSAWGLWLWFRSRDRRLQELALGVAAISLVCIVFFAALRPQGDRNYGGMTSGFRWLFWLAPLWLAAMLPAADRLAASRAGRAIGLVLLALSVLSASYPTWNPWSHPWIYRAMEWAGLAV